MMVWFVGLFVKLGFLVLILVFLLNFLGRLVAPFRSARQTTAYYASVFPGAGAGPASPGRPVSGVAPGPGAAVLPPLALPDIARLSPLEQEAARTLTYPVGRFRAQGIELRREGQRTFLIAIIEWTGTAGEYSITWIGLSRRYTSLVWNGMELAPVRISGAADLDGLFERFLAKDKDYTPTDFQREIGFSSGGGRTVPGLPNAIRLTFEPPIPPTALDNTGWWQLRVTAWTNDSLRHVPQTQFQRFRQKVLDPLWILDNQLQTIPVPSGVALTGALWVPSGKPPEAPAQAGTKAPAQEPKQGQSPSQLKGKP